MFNRLLNSIPWIRRWRLRRAWRRFDAISVRAKIWEFQRQLEDKQKAHLEAEGSRAMREMLDDIQEWQAAQAAGDAVVEQFANLIDPERAAQAREQAKRDGRSQGAFVTVTEPDDGSQRYLQRLRDKQAADIAWSDRTLLTFPPAFRVPQRLFELLRQLPSFSRLTNEQLARLVERQVLELDRWASCLSLQGVQAFERYLDGGLAPPAVDLAPGDSFGEEKRLKLIQAQEQMLYYQNCQINAGKKADDKQRSLPPQPWPGLCDCGHWYDD